MAISWKTRFLLLPAFIFALAVLSPDPGACAPWKKKEVSIGQVYTVTGKVLLKGAKGAETEVKPGALLGAKDVLSLEKGAAVGIYFREGGRQEVEAKSGALSRTVSELVPGREDYRSDKLAFGATRGRTGEDGGFRATVNTGAIHYPRKSLVLGASPHIEFTVHYEPGSISMAPEATLMIMDDDAVLLSKKEVFVSGKPLRFDGIELVPGKEYTFQVKMTVPEVQEKEVVFSMPIYRAFPGAEEAFADSVYRSVEYSLLGNAERQKQLLIIKQLKRSEDGKTPVIAAEAFLM